MENGNQLENHKDSEAGRLWDSILVKAAVQVCLLSYSARCPQPRWISAAFVLSHPSTMSLTNSVSPQMSASAASETRSGCRHTAAHKRRLPECGSQSQDSVFSALWAHAVRISSVNNRPFSHGLFRISDETAEMSMRGVSLQSESSSATLLFFTLTAIIFEEEKNSPCLLLYLFYDLGCC